jgi:hypothetical protein
MATTRRLHLRQDTIFRSPWDNGISPFGSALAIAISYTTNHSILWAIIHGILSWLYVIYFSPF